MRTLLLGYSDIARRRILPALAAVGIIEVDIASRSAAPPLARPPGLSGIDFSDYEAALAQSPAELVWISTTNASHARLAAAALDAGRHVVIDKPATTTLADAETLVARARSSGKLLAEATVYGFHPQFAAIRRFFAEAGSTPTQLIAAFSFPPLPASNFRQQPDQGGGVELDLGPYAMSVGRLLFDAAPLGISAYGLDGDAGFSLIVNYPGGRMLTGHFGATTGYANRLLVLGPRATLTIDRAFTTAPDAVCRLAATLDNTPSEVAVPAADSFAMFLQTAFSAIEARDTSAFASALLEDARARALLADALAITRRREGLGDSSGSIGSSALCPAFPGGKAAL